MRVVLNAELVWDSQQQRVGRCDGFVLSQLLDQQGGLGSIRTAKDGPRVRIDQADLISSFAAAAEVRPITIVDQRKDAATHRHAWLTLMSRFLPCRLIRAD